LSLSLHKTGECKAVLSLSCLPTGSGFSHWTQYALGRMSLLTHLVCSLHFPVEVSLQTHPLSIPSHGHPDRHHDIFHRKSCNQLQIQMVEYSDLLCCSPVPQVRWSLHIIACHRLPQKMPCIRNGVLQSSHHLDILPHCVQPHQW